MPAKRKQSEAKGDPEQGKLKRRKLEEKEQEKDEEKKEEESSSDADYEPSESDNSTTESEEDDPTTSEEESASEADGADDADGSSSSSSSSEGDSGSSTGDDEDNDDGKDKKSDEKKKSAEKEEAGRESGGHTLRALKEDRKAPEDTLKLPDLAHEHLLLDINSPESGNSRVACIKGRVYLSGDRIRVDGNVAEVVGFGKDEIHVHWLLQADEVPGMGIRHGNFMRVLPSTVVPLGSLTELQHTPKEVAGQASTAKITHQIRLRTFLTRSEILTRLKTSNDGPSPVEVVKGDKGRWRPSLYGTEQRWNAGEQKRLLIFLRRIWPLCSRPSSVTITMQPPAHEDRLASFDDQADDVADIHAITSKYRDIWTATIARTDPNAAQAQRWMANAFDTWRRLYISVAQTDWETCHREFWAAAASILTTTPSH